MNNQHILGHLDRYTILKKLGSGISCNVYLGHAFSGTSLLPTEYAIKMFKVNVSYEETLKEIEALQ